MVVSDASNTLVSICDHISIGIIGANLTHEGKTNTVKLYSKKLLLFQ